MRVLLLFGVMLVLLTSGCDPTPSFEREQSITPIVRIDYNDTLVRQEVLAWIEWVDHMRRTGVGNGYKED